MSEESARLLREAERDPQDPDEVWEAIQEFNEGIDWDLHKMLPEYYGDDE